MNSWVNKRPSLQSPDPHLTGICSRSHCGPFLSTWLLTSLPLPTSSSTSAQCLHTPAVSTELAHKGPC